MPELTAQLLTVRLVTLVAELLLLGLALLLVWAEYRRGRRFHLRPLATSLALLILVLGVQGTLSASQETQGVLFSPFIAALLGVFRSLAFLTLFMHCHSLLEAEDTGDGAIFARAVLWIALGAGLVIGIVYQMPDIYGIPTGAQTARILFSLLLMGFAAVGTRLLWQTEHPFRDLMRLAVVSFGFWGLFDLLAQVWVPFIFVGEVLVSAALVTLAVRLVTVELTSIAGELSETAEQLEVSARGMRQLHAAAGTLLRAGSIRACVTALIDLLTISFGLKQGVVFLLNPSSGMWELWRQSPVSGQALVTDEIPLERRQFLTEIVLAGHPYHAGQSAIRLDQDFLNLTGFSKQVVLIPLVAPRVSYTPGGDTSKLALQRGSAWKSDPCWQADRVCQQGLGNFPQRLKTCQRCPAFEPLGAIAVDLRSLPGGRQPGFEVMEALGQQASLALRDLMQIEELVTDIRFRTAALDPLPLGIVLLGPDGRITAINRLVRQLAGPKAASWLGSHLGEVPLTTRPEQLQRIIREMLTKPSEEGVELAAEVVGPQGKRECLLRLQPLLRNHVLTGVLVTVEDRTETRELQRTVMQQERFAAMGQLAMGIAHEVNNPIAGVSGLLQMLTKRLPAEAAEQRPIQTAIKDLRRASDTIRSLLQFARPRPTTLQPLDINALVTEIIDLQAFHPQAKDVAFHTDLAPALSLAQTDRESLAQVLTNLIINALQAMGGTGSITLGTFETAQRVLISVRDTGPGIPADILPRIFEPFFTTKKPGQGTGLGLSLCEMILGGLGASLAVVSTPEGTEFLILLPKVKRPSEPLMPENAVADTPLMVLPPG
ncbi:MAG: Adaptive-response sensory-kinase SasA [bacterium]|nr:Adaptive-response sensory-kinase SasA [bacterium]